MAVTPQAGLVSKVTTGGTPVVPVPPNPTGGFITNPTNASESLFVDPVTDAGVAPSGTTFELKPGQTWNIIAGQTTRTSVNSTDSNHEFSVVWWP